MIKRILLSTINYDHPQLGILHAFRGIFGEKNVYNFDYLEQQRRGYEVEFVNMAFLKAVEQARPDWIFLQVQDTGVLTAETILEAKKLFPKTVISHWTGDARPAISPYLQSICKATDLTLVSNVGQLPNYRDCGAKIAQYMQIGVDWHEDVMGEPDWTPPFRVPDVVFIGSYYGDMFPEGSAERLSAIRALMAAGIDVGVVGSGWPTDVNCIGQCGVKQQHHVWKRAKVCLSINHFNNIDRYYSDRQLISMVSGTPVVCRYVPGLEHEFKEDFHCCFYSDEDDLLTNFKLLLKDDEGREFIGRNGRAEVIKNHTWFSRITEVLSTIERLQEAS